MRRLAFALLFIGVAGCDSKPPTSAGGQDDLAQAKELLAKVKLPENFEVGIWHMTYARPYVPEPEKVVQIIKENLSKIGLKVKLEGFNQNIYNNKLRDPDHPMFLLGWSADYADPDNFLNALLSGDAIGPDKAKPTGNNHSFFDHPDFNRLCKEAQSEPDPKKRADLYTAALKIYHDEIPSIPIAHVGQFAVCRKEVKYNLHPIEYRLWSIDPGDGGTLLYSRADPTDSLDPHDTAWGGSAKITVNLYETLVTFGADSTELIPGLAESWERSPDGLTWTFKLRKGVKFHDGTDFNAAAVVFAFERLLNKGDFKPKKNPYGSEYEDIATVTAKDDATVVFTIKNPSLVFLHKLAMFPAAIPSPSAVRKHGDQFGKNPVGTGRLKFVSWEQDVKIEMARHADYWGPSKSAAERVIVLEVKDVQTAIQKLKNKEAHVMDDVALADLPALEKDPALRIETETGMNVCYVGFNMRKAPYNDPNFRKAVALAIDLKKLNEIAYHGRAEMAKSFIPPTIFPTPSFLGK